MSESRKTIDARGKACPAPVILTKKALEDGGWDLLEILVDNAAARENVLRFAGYSGRSVVEVGGEPPSITIVLAASGSEGSEGAARNGPKRESGSSPASEAEDRSGRAGPAGSTVFLSSDRLGRGDDELGALLMRGFVYALAEQDDPPARIILMNTGVRLAAEGSESVGNLKRLADRGVDILVCGTCLEFLGLRDRIAAGRVSNMYEIAGHLTSERVLSV